ncbi:hypothetical protein [Streptomyces sp. Y2F8-2]|uniref:hypothetical protein n=2 Tax=unclassified Streptomyces TaxID=2593676 RepID=UPI0019073B0E|nr:hypothetical protein [Streptomyces sp. Y2F8-2]
MAKPGYGKRSAPDQLPSRAGDFDHLPAREAYLASLLDRLPVNAAMDAKTIAKSQPLYGQQAVRSALNELSKAGHLRRVRRRVEPGGEGDAATGTRWVFHTYWSRTARDDAWWARFLDGDPVPQRTPEPGVTPTATLQPELSHPQTVGRPSAAYAALAGLGLRDPRLALSSGDCSDLEQLAEDWLARGTTPEYLAQVLLAGLPEQVYSPRAFVQRRLIDKMPPERPTTPSRTPRTLMECTDCGVPGRPEALLGGLCRACRGGDGSAHAIPLVDMPLSAQEPGHTVSGMTLRLRMRQALPEAMRARDKVAVSALRATLAALDNAEAVPVGEAELRGTALEESPVGVGVAEAQRRELSERSVADIVRAEATERLEAADQLTAPGHADRAAQLRAEAAVLLRFLEDPGAG